jgi:phage shock protein A
LTPAPAQRSNALGGAFVANLNETAKDRRGDQDAQIAAATTSVGETERAVADNHEIVPAEIRRIERLNEAHRATAYEAEIALLGKRITFVDESLRTAQNDELAITAAVANPRAQNADAGSLEKRRAAMEREVSALRGEHDNLLAAVATMPQDVDAPSV